MAVSLETQAIIDRLKAEGDLIRNTGTNSIKSVNVSLEKFGDVFDTISANIAEQTKILQMQAGIATEALEAARTKEQLDEIESKQQEKDSNESDERIGTKIGEGIDKAFTLSGLSSGLKNLAKIAGGGFLAYNLGKGFINQVTDGGFDKAENEVVKTAKETYADLKSFGADMKKTASDFNKSISELKTELGNLKEEIAGLKTAVYAAVGAIGVLSIIPWVSLARSIVDIGKELLRRNPPKPKTDSPNAPKTKADGPDTPKPKADEPDAPKPKADGPDAPKPKGAEPESTKYNQSVTPKSNSTYGGRTSVGMDTLEARAQLRADIAAKSGSGYRLTKSGKLQGPDGKFASDEDALKYMEKTLDPKYSKVFKNLVKVLKVAGVAALLLAAYQIYEVLTNDSMSPKDKKIALGGLMGEVLGGAGGATIGAIAGAMGGPWGALIGGLVGGLVGVFAGGYLGEWIVRWAFDESPTAKDDADAKQIERDYVKRFVDDEAAMSQPVVSHNAKGDIMPLHYGDLQYGMGIQGYNEAARSRARIEAENAARKSPEVLPPLKDAPKLQLQYGGRGNGHLEMGYRNGRSSARSSSLEMIESYIMGRAGGNVYIDASTNAPVTYSNMDAGDNISMVQLSSGGGGQSSVNAFGLAGLTNAYNV